VGSLVVAWQIELLKILGAAFLALVTYCLGRRTRINEAAHQRDDYQFRRTSERTGLQENAELLLKYSELHSTLEDKRQTIDQLAELMKASQRIDKLSKGSTEDRELGKLVAGLIDDQVQTMFDLCVLTEEYMRLSDKFEQEVSPYLLARFDLERMLLFLAVRMLESAPKEWGFPRDPTGSVAGYMDYLKRQLEKDSLGHIAIHHSDAVFWKREDMEAYVRNLLATLREPELGKV